MNGLKGELLIKARDEIEKHIQAYEQRAETSNEVLKSQRDKERAILFKYIKAELASKIPNSIIITEGKYICPNCKTNIESIRTAAERECIKVRFCPACSQAFNEGIV